MDYDKPFLYEGHEISRLEDLKAFITLQPEKALQALAKSKIDNRPDHEKTDEILRAEKEANDDFDSKLDSVRPKGKYYEQSMGDFLLFMQEVDKLTDG